MTLVSRAVIAGLSAIPMLGALVSSTSASQLGLLKEFHGAPGPVVGAGLPVILIAGVVVFAVARLRRKQGAVRAEK